MTESQLLESLQSEYDALWTPLDGLVKSAKPASWEVALPDNGMTTAQLVEHLCVSADPYIALIGEALGSAQASDGSAEVKQTFIGKFLLTGLRKGRLPLPPPLHVANSVSSKDALRRWKELDASTRRLLKQASGKSLSAPKYANPLLKIAKMNAADGLAIAVQHLAYHAPQLRARLTP